MDTPRHTQVIHILDKLKRCVHDASSSGNDRDAIHPGLMRADHLRMEVEEVRVLRERDKQRFELMLAEAERTKGKLLRQVRCSERWTMVSLCREEKVRETATRDRGENDFKFCRYYSQKQAAHTKNRKNRKTEPR